MHQKHIEFKKKSIQNFFRPCPTGDTSLWDFSLMTLLRPKTTKNYPLYTLRGFNQSIILILNLYAYWVGRNPQLLVWLEARLGLRVEEAEKFHSSCSCL